eukprot:CAMPEP_0115542866 /NCGR_PEP_ID=MMETSP0271-20121206/91238_1 /TAXON_ID=71861 /ORGANISM="Scrippsiella trochoidea, Strain CCMP3099" /LENGTH=50 /DNA_ID=CAMNT_0002976053 /DNA_START=230 /DNA_END=382 /DNA_ORIENTATION=+
MRILDDENPLLALRHLRILMDDELRVANAAQKGLAILALCRDELPHAQLV